MTWIGKTLVIVNFLLALVWCGFTAASYAARANWKAEADKARSEAKKAADDAELYRKQVMKERSENDALRQSLASAVARQQQIITSMNTINAQLTDTVVARLRDDGKDDPQNLKQLIDTGKVQADLDDKNAKLLVLESALDKVTKAAQFYQNQRDDAVRGQNTFKIANDKIIEDLRRVNDQIDAIKRGESGTSVVAPEGFRASVQTVDGIYAEINQGANSGLKEGTLLRITRKDKFIGYFLVEELSPSTATGRFRLPAGVRVGGDNLPKLNDEVTAR